MKDFKLLTDGSRIAPRNGAIYYWVDDESMRDMVHAALIYIVRATRVKLNFIETVYDPSNIRIIFDKDQFDPTTKALAYATLPEYDTSYVYMGSDTDWDYSRDYSSLTGYRYKLLVVLIHELLHALGITIHHDDDDALMDDVVQRYEVPRISKLTKLTLYHLYDMVPDGMPHGTVITKPLPRDYVAPKLSLFEKISYKVVTFFLRLYALIKSKW